MVRIFGLLPCIPMQVFPGDGGLRAVSTRSISICRYPLCKAPATKQGNKEEIAFSLQCERETREREGKRAEAQVGTKPRMAGYPSALSSYPSAPAGFLRR